MNMTTKSYAHVPGSLRASYLLSFSRSASSVQRSIYIPVRHVRAEPRLRAHVVHCTTARGDGSCCRSPATHGKSISTGSPK
jgi:hypothetical protein